MSTIKLTSENFFETINTGKTLVDFFAVWCGPCKMMAPIIEEIANDASVKAVVAKVDIDSERQLAMRYNISCVPTVILFENGVEKKRFEGVHPKETYLAEI